MAKRRQATWRELTAVSTNSAAWIIKNLGFVLFLGFVTIVYIANNHYAQRTLREIKVLQEELKEKRRIYNALNAEYMRKSKRSELEQQVKPYGLRPSKQAPKKIIVQAGE